MKVLIYGLNYAPEPVGIGKYSGELGGWLAGRGHQVRAITAPPYFPQWHAKANRYRQELIGKVTVWRCPLWVPKKPNGITRLLHLASFAISSLPVLLSQWRWRPDLLICVAPALFCAPGALVLKRLCGPHTVVWLHIQDFELDAAFELGLLQGERMRKTAERLESRLLRSFQKVSSISEAMRQRTITKGVAPSRAELIPNWVDLNAIRPEPYMERQHNPYRQELGLRTGQLVLLYSGSINQKQGLEILVEVISALSEYKNLVWILAGEGPGKKPLQAATRHLPQVRHLPLQPVERLSDWLNLADIHLLPQKAAAADLVLPSKLLGILASGRPVVAGSPEGSTLGKLAEQAGRRVNPGDAKAFTKAIEELVRSAQKRQQLGKKARQLVEQSYGINTVLELFEQEALSAISQNHAKP